MRFVFSLLIALALAGTVSAQVVYYPHHYVRVRPVVLMPSPPTIVLGAPPVMVAPTLPVFAIPSPTPTVVVNPGSTVAVRVGLFRWLNVQVNTSPK